MIGELKLLIEFVKYDGGYVNFAGAKGGCITGKGKVTNGKITLDGVNYVEQLKHNLMSVSQICDKGHSVHFTKSEALVLKPGVKIPEEWIIMKAPRRNDTYIMDMSVQDDAKEEPTCLLSKASETDKMLWHRRMTHLHFKKTGYITKHDLVLCVPQNSFGVEDKCMSCKKGK